MSTNLIHSYLTSAANFTMNHIIRPLGSLDKRVLGAFAVVFGLACAGVNYLYSIKKKNLPITTENPTTQIVKNVENIKKEKSEIIVKAEQVINSLFSGLNENELRDKMKQLTHTAWDKTKEQISYSPFSDLIGTFAKAGLKNEIMMILETIIDTTNHNYPIRIHILQIISTFSGDDKFNNIDLLALAFLVATRKKDDNFKSMLLCLVDDLKAPDDISRQQRFAKQFNASATREERKAFIQSVNKHILANLIRELNNSKNMP